MLTAFSFILTLRKHLTYVNTLYHKKEIRHLNGKEIFSHSGLHWNNVTAHSLSARMDGTGNAESTESLLEIAATTGLENFDSVVNDLMVQTRYTLTSEVRGNGPDGWMFAPSRHDHVTSILSQLNNELLGATTYATRDPRRWTNLDAAQDRPYWLANLEHSVSF
jgi:hypothetical protein